jgi:hypothetical protein
MNNKLIYKQIFGCISYKIMKCQVIYKIEEYQYKKLRGSRGNVLAVGIHVRGFKPGRSRRIFRAKKSSARLPSEGK